MRCCCLDTYSEANDFPVPPLFYLHYTLPCHAASICALFVLDIDSSYLDNFIHFIEATVFSS